MASSPGGRDLQGSPPLRLLPRGSSAASSCISQVSFIRIAQGLGGRFLTFLVVTDIHPDQYYQVHSSTDQDDACHRGKGPAGPYGAETSDCDAPFALVNATFDWIADNLKDEIDFVIWTGDSARHDRECVLKSPPLQKKGFN